MTNVHSQTVTINSVLSLLTTAMKAFLLFSIAACLGQAKWLHFGSRPHSLIDLIVYDSASRGPIGSVQLLWRLRAKQIASLGAIITILAIGIDPTVQQTIAIGSSPRNSTTIAMLGRAQSFLQYPEFGLIMSEMAGAFYAGTFFGTRHSDNDLTSLDVIPTCSTGNCTFPPFRSLAVCSSCENITAALNKTCYYNTSQTNSTFQGYNGSWVEVDRYCQLSLPNGLKVNTSADDYDGADNYDGGALVSSGYLPPVGRPNYGNILLNFSMITASSTDRSRNLIGSSKATQCFLYWCVNQYESRVENGRLREETTGSWHGEPTEWVGSSFPGVKRLELVPSGLAESSSASNFIVAFLATDGLSSWLSEKLSFSNSRTLGQTHRKEDFLVVTMPALDVSSNTSEGEILKLFRDSDLSLIFPHIAKSMTSIVRSYSSSQQSYLVGADGTNLAFSGVGPANGTAHYNEIYIFVRWPWLALSGALVLLTVIHLTFTMIDTARHDVGVWKLSPIALLFHGLDVSELDQLRKASELAGMEALASQIDVQLRDSGDGFMFTR